MTDDLSVFELQDSGDSPLATALAQAAAWQARAERMEGALQWASGAPDFQPGGQARLGWERLADPALASPRPSPSRLLEVVRAGLAWEEECKARPHVRELYLKALDRLRNALAALTPEEKAVILGEE